MLHVRGNRVPKYYPNSEQSMVTPHIFLISINPSGTKLYADKKNKQMLSVANMQKMREMSIEKNNLCFGFGNPGKNLNNGKVHYYS